MDKEPTLEEIAQRRDEQLMREYRLLARGNSLNKADKIRALRETVAALPPEHRKAVEADMKLTDAFEESRRRQSPERVQNPIVRNGNRYRLDEPHHPPDNGKHHRR